MLQACACIALATRYSLQWSHDCGRASRTINGTWDIVADVREEKHCGGTCDAMLMTALILSAD